MQTEDHHLSKTHTNLSGILTTCTCICYMSMFFKVEMHKALYPNTQPTTNGMIQCIRTILRKKWQCDLEKEERVDLGAWFLAYDFLSVVNVFGMPILSQLSMCHKSQMHQNPGVSRTNLEVTSTFLAQDFLPINMCLYFTPFNLFMQMKLYTEWEKCCDSHFDSRRKLKNNKEHILPYFNSRKKWLENGFSFHHATTG